MSFNHKLDKESLDYYLNELAKEFRRLNRKGYPIEIIMVGGAAIIASYGFRESTLDVDCYATIDSSLKMAIRHVGDRFGLDHDWLNADFMHTASFSHKIVEFSKHYKNFNHAFSVRVISGEHLIAMKMVSARLNKYDYSDILGILIEHHRLQQPILFENIKQAVLDLYQQIDIVSLKMWLFVENLVNSDHLEVLYLEHRYLEIFNAEISKVRLKDMHQLEKILQKLEM